MNDDLDDLTLVYMYGFKNGRDSMKDEVQRLETVLREFFTSGDFDIVTTGNEEATQAWIERARAALAGGEDR